MENQVKIFVTILSGVQSPCAINYEFDGFKATDDDHVIRLLRSAQGWCWTLTESLWSSIVQQLLLNSWETIGTDRARGVDWTTEATNTDSKDYESSKQDACIFKGSDEKRRDYQEINTTTQAIDYHRCRSNSAYANHHRSEQQQIAPQSRARNAIRRKL
jgi:hypothetical protein